VDRDDVYLSAKAFSTQVSVGDVKVKHEGDAEASGNKAPF
jgi:hypothetical protein